VELYLNSSNTPSWRGAQFKHRDNFTLHLMEASGQLHAPAALPPGKSLRYPLDRSLGGPQGWYERSGEVKNPCLCRESNSSRPARSLVTTLIALFRPHMISCNFRRAELSLSVRCSKIYVLFPVLCTLLPFTSVIYLIPYQTSPRRTYILKKRLHFYVHQIFRE
jgi:hypothetical protein